MEGKESNGTSRALDWSLDGLEFQPLVEKHSRYRLWVRMRSVLGKELFRDYGLTLCRCPVSGQIHKSRAEGKSYIRDTDLGITCILITKTLKINISQEIYEDE